MGIINLKKTITPEALAAMSRNTLADGSIEKDVMDKFDQALNERLDKIPNVTLKKAINEAVREKAISKLVTAAPKDVDKILKDSFNEVAKELGIAPPKKPRAPRKKPEPSYRSYGYGGK